MVVSWRRLMLLVWRHKPTVKGIESTRRLLQSWANCHPSGVGILIVVPRHHQELPDEAIRQALDRAAVSLSPHFKGLATLLESGGDIPASTRVYMSRLHSRTSQRVAPVIVGKTTDAAAWAAALLGDPTITAGTLEAVIGSARQH